MNARICDSIQKCIIDELPNIVRLRNKRKIKKDGSFVTEGDLRCEKTVINCARSFRGEAFEIISEEKDCGDFVYDARKNYIVLDPIDGTENFTSGLKEWGVSVSVYKKGTHAESMIFLPELGLCIKTGDRILKHESRIRGLSSSLTKNHFQNLKNGLEYRVMGCCVYNLYNAITGSFISFENPKGACAWDVLAGFNLALEHGCSVVVEGKKYTGEFLDPRRKYQFIVRHA